MKKFIFLSLILSFNALANNISVNGFGTLSFEQSDSSISTNYGVSNRPNFADNSVAGLTIRNYVDENWDFVFQFLAEGNDGEMASNVDLLQATYRPTSNTYIRVGKIRLPIWMISNYYNVGALYPWLRPPQEVYEAQPGIALYGGNFSYRYIYQDLTIDAELYGGSTKFKSNGETKFSGEVSDIIGSNLTINHQHTTFKVAYAQGRFAGEISILQKDAIGSTYDGNITANFNLGKAEFFSAGIKSEFNDFLLWAEYAQEKTTSDNLKKLDAYYMTGGYYFDNKKYLLHITHSEITKRQSSQTFFQGTQDAQSIGLNYSPNPSVVFKSQFKQINPDGKGLFTNTPSKSSINQWGASMNFMF